MALGVFGMVRVLELLAEHGWNVLIQEDLALNFPPAIERRYALVPDAVKDFLAKIVCCTSQDEQSWFFGGKDYQEQLEGGFSWDGIEQLALGGCSEPEDRARIVQFWDKHFPIAISVRSDYDYFAVCLRQEQFGSIVHGYAPEWEEPRQVSTSFEEFLQMFERALKGSTRPYPFFVFV